MIGPDRTMVIPGQMLLDNRDIQELAVVHLVAVVYRKQHTIIVVLHQIMIADEICHVRAATPHPYDHHHIIIYHRLQTACNMPYHRDLAACLHDQMREVRRGIVCREMAETAEIVIMVEGLDNRRRIMWTPTYRTTTQMARHNGETIVARWTVTLWTAMSDTQGLPHAAAIARHHDWTTMNRIDLRSVGHAAEVPIVIAIAIATETEETGGMTTETCTADKLVQQSLFLHAKPALSETCTAGPGPLTSIDL
jgi:hypothetical protein